MAYSITVKAELSFEDLQSQCWSGALDTLNTIAENDMEDAFMSFLAYDMSYEDNTPTLTEINDLLWFDDEFIFETLGIKSEDEDEEEEEDDDPWDDDPTIDEAWDGDRFDFPDR